MTFLTILRSFNLGLEGKTGEVVPEPSRLDFLEKYLGNDFASPDAEDNTSEPLNTSITYLPLQVWQLRELFCKYYQPVWNLL